MAKKSAGDGEDVNASELCEQFYSEMVSNCSTGLKMKETEVGACILELSRSTQVEVVLCSILHICEMERIDESPTEEQSRRWIPNPWSRGEGMLRIPQTLLKRKLPFSEKQIKVMLDRILEGKSSLSRDVCFLRPIKNFAEKEGLSQAIAEKLKTWQGRLDSDWEATVIDTIQSLLILCDAEDDRISANSTLIEPTGEAWVVAAEEYWLASKNRIQWSRLLSHCTKASGSKPSVKWSSEGDVLVSALGSEFTDFMLAMLPAIGKPGEPQVIHYTEDVSETLDATLVHDQHTTLLRGLIWSASLIDDDDLVWQLGETAGKCFEKIVGVGPRSTRIGNACLIALAQNPSPKAVLQIVGLKPRCRQKSVANLIAKALQLAAKGQGISVSDLEELHSGDCGLTSVGRMETTVGEFTAELSIMSTSRTGLVWIKPDGKAQKTIPAAIKIKLAAEIKGIKKNAKEIVRLLSAHRLRIEQFYRQQRQLVFGDFGKHYLDHRLTGFLTRKLVWSFSKGRKKADGIWIDGKLIDRKGKEIVWLDESTSVKLWHPIDSSTKVILEWREFLERQGISQPFKQAHREVYLVTDAEMATETYSNRFAAHILNQHQFNELCRQRGWGYQMQGQWDGGSPAKVEVPEYGVRAEFHVEPFSHENVNVSPAGIYSCLTTDGVRFFKSNSDQEMKLSEIPKPAFSEIMRDVDLFVGVCSIGNDPAWQEGGRTDYWQRYSFGTLSELAQTRRQALERIVPQLKIAGQCSLAERYLVVKGKLRTWHIHLGSGNVLLQPGDCAVCIVADRSSGKNTRDIFLPFEGDEQLSIILSKALLLAADDKIKDPLIRSQMGD